MDKSQYRWQERSPTRQQRWYVRWSPWSVAGILGVIALISVLWRTDSTTLSPARTQADTSPEVEIRAARSLARATWVNATGTLLIFIGTLTVALVAQNFSAQQQNTSLQIAQDQQQENELQSYLDRMSDLLLTQHLATSQPNDAVRQVAQARTLTLLRRVTDGTRKGLVVRFLHDANLVKMPQGGTDVFNPIISLKDADLVGAHLQDVNLEGVNLAEAHLAEADLSWADLRRAHLLWADLGGANLSYARLDVAHLHGATLGGANLGNADLVGADLSDANMALAKLHGANLVGANLVGANLVGANLSHADLQGADLGSADLLGVNVDAAVYDDTTRWPPNFNPVKAGAKFSPESTPPP